MDGACVKKCPAGAYRLENGLRTCTAQTDACTFFAYEKNLTLIATGAKERLCLNSCPLYHLKFGECVLECPGFVEADQLCAPFCSSGAFLADSQHAGVRRCVSVGCPAPLLKIGEEFGMTECAGACPAERPFEYAGKCVDRCPDGTPFVRGGACVRECPKFVQAFVSRSAGAYLKCVSQCGASIEWKNGTRLCSGCRNDESALYDFARGRFVHCMKECGPRAPEVVSGVCAA